MEDPKNAVFGRFELLGHIATGGMAELFLARQRGLEGFEKLVVIKRLLADLAQDAEVVKLFLNEARIAARLNHPNVIQIYDLGRAGESYFIAMEYIQGENVRAILRQSADQRRCLALPHGLEIIRQVSEGLHYAHTLTDAKNRPLNIVHCDVSPQNILVSFDGVAKVVDFGIARAAASLGGEYKRVRGKRGYLSPEDCLGRTLDARSDLFSLGVVLWEVCTTRRLFRRETSEDASQAILAGQVPPPSSLNPQVRESLDAVVLRALHLDPDRRFQTAAEFGAAIEQERRCLHQESGTRQLSAFMHKMFPDRLAMLQRIEEARARGESPNVEWLKRERDPTGSIESFRPDAPPARPHTPIPRPPNLELRSPNPPSVRYGRPPTIRIRRRRRSLQWLWVVVGLGGLSVLGLFYMPEVLSARDWLRNSVTDMVEQFQSGPVTSGTGNPVAPATGSPVTSGTGNPVAPAIGNPVAPAIGSPVAPATGSPVAPATGNPVTPATGNIVITSEPPGASVLLGGRRRCTTPCTLERMPFATDLLLRVIRAQFESQDSVIRLNPDAPEQRIHLRLKRSWRTSFGQVEVITEPEGAVVELDGMLLPSITPTVLDRIPPGRHELRAWIDPKETWVVRFRLYPGQKRTLLGSLPKPGAPSIEVEIEPESEPSEPGDEEIVPKESEKKELGDKTVP